MACAYDSIKDITEKKEIWKLAVKVESLWTLKRGKDEQVVEFIIRDVKVNILFHTVLHSELFTEFLDLP
jgi:hypothetical protein